MNLLKRLNRGLSELQGNGQTVVNIESLLDGPPGGP